MSRRDRRADTFGRPAGRAALRWTTAGDRGGARAVNSNAKILLLDEPLAAMGAREAGLIIDLILRLKAAGGLSIMMIMHNYAQALEIADHIILMQRGQVTYENRAQSTSVEELMEIVRREYRAVRNG